MCLCWNTPENPPTYYCSKILSSRCRIPRRNTEGGKLQTERPTLSSRRRTLNAKKPKHQLWASDAELEYQMIEHQPQTSDSEWLNTNSEDWGPMTNFKCRGMKTNFQAPNVKLLISNERAPPPYLGLPTNEYQLQGSRAKNQHQTLRTNQWLGLKSFDLDRWFDAMWNV